MIFLSLCLLWRWACFGIGPRLRHGLEPPEDSLDRTGTVALAQNGHRSELSPIRFGCAKRATRLFPVRTNRPCGVARGVRDRRADSMQQCPWVANAAGVAYARLCQTATRPVGAGSEEARGVPRIGRLVALTGAVALFDRGARVGVVGAGRRSDRVDEFVERGRDARTTIAGFVAEFVVPTSQVLDEGVTADDDARGLDGLQAAHRS